MEYLYREYERSIEIQKNVIQSTNEKLRQAKASCNRSEIKRLNTLMRVLYEEKWELEEKSRELKKYLNMM